jgi:hypothetical protein
MKLNEVTLVSVTGINHVESVNSLIQCSRFFEFNSIKFLSNLKPPNCVDTIEFIEIDALNSKNMYSWFVLYELQKYVTTDYCLVTQYDSCINHPEMWSWEFLNYDYIGAPWPIMDRYINGFGEQCRVGNGGFSLRSKKLLEQPTQLNIPFDLSEWGEPSNNEDLNICVFNKHLYKNIKIAPLDIAVRFSHEVPIPEIKNTVAFGKHGNYNQK